MPGQAFGSGFLWPLRGGQYGFLFACYDVLRQRRLRLPRASHMWRSLESTWGMVLQDLGVVGVHVHRAEAVVSTVLGVYVLGHWG